MLNEVLLLYPPGLSYITPPLGLAYLAAVLKREGISVQILDASVEGLSCRQTIGRIKDIRPEIIGITARSPDYNMIEKLIWLIKNGLPSASIVLGGPHPTIVPEEVLKYSPADYVVRGEGELTFLELCRFLFRKNGKTLPDIQGISYRSNGGIVHNADRPFINNLDEIPLPSRELLPVPKYRNYGQVVKRKPVAAMITSRGCPFGCIFCSNAVFGRRYRFNSPGRVIEEIKYLQERYGIKEINFMEENFTANPSRVKIICDRIIDERLDISWNCQAHVNTLDKDLLKDMKRAGCWFIHIGVESADNQVLKILKKGINLERTRQVFKEAHEAGIRTLAYFMVGNYADTKETVRRTIDFSLRLDTDFIAFSITTPFPGTELFRRAKSERLIMDESYDYLNSQRTSIGAGISMLRTKELTISDLARYQKIATRKFYLRPKQIFLLLGRIRTRHQVTALLDLVRAFFGVNHRSYYSLEDIKKEVSQHYNRMNKDLLPNCHCEERSDESEASPKGKQSL